MWKKKLRLVKEVVKIVVIVKVGHCVGFPLERCRACLSDVMEARASSDSAPTAQKFFWFTNLLLRWRNLHYCKSNWLNI
jgi:hypothetical protein